MSEAGSETTSEGADRRCPTCGALVGPEAEWCGQCFSSLVPKAEEGARVRSAVSMRRDPATPQGVTPLHARPGDPAWPCPVCDNRNPIELQACAACGTPFGHGYGEPEPPPDVEPRSAFLWSLLFPGLGQLRCGKAFEGAARAVLFTWTLGAAILLLVSRSGKGGLGSLGPLFGLFAVCAFVVYALSALDAHRVASGEGPLVSARMLLWGSVGLIVVSAALAALVTIRAVRGG